MRKLLYLNVFLLTAGLWAGPALAQDVEHGVKLYREHRFPEAEKELRQVLANDPENLRAREFLSRSLAGLQRHEEAEEEIRRAEEAGLSEDRVKVARAEAAITRKDAEGAVTLLDEAVEIDPENADAYYLRGMAHTYFKRFDAGVQDLEKSIELYPENPYAYYYLGMAYNGVKRPDRMIDNMQRFLQMAPEAPDSGKVRSLLRGVR